MSAGRPPSTALTRGMVYLETSDGLARGDARHGPVARHLVSIARIAGEYVWAHVGEWYVGAEERDGQWAVAVMDSSDGRRSAWARRKVLALLGRA